MISVGMLRTVMRFHAEMMKITKCVRERNANVERGTNPRRENVTNSVRTLFIVYEVAVVLWLLPFTVISIYTHRMLV